MQRMRFERADADNCQIARWKGVEVVGKEGNTGGVHLIFIVCERLHASSLARRAAVFCRTAHGPGGGKGEQAVSRPALCGSALASNPARRFLFVVRQPWVRRWLVGHSIFRPRNARGSANTVCLTHRFVIPFSLRNISRTPSAMDNAS